MGFFYAASSMVKLYIAREEEGKITLKPLYSESGFTVDDR